MKKHTCLDLFCGAGGLSEGFLETGRYDLLAHVEWEKPMVETLRNNLSTRWGYSKNKAKKSVVRFDVQKTDELLHGHWSNESKKNYLLDNDQMVAELGLDGLIGKKKIDVVIGGPPCQAYSIAGRAQDKNSMKDDYRNYLFESFVKVVDCYKPEVFVFENVPGILSARPGDELVIERIYNAFQKIGYKIRTPQYMKCSVYSASDYCVPQNRNRVIIFGVKTNGKYKLEDFYNALNNERSTGPKKTVRDAIGDMPKLVPLDKPSKNGREGLSHYQIDGKLIPHHKPRYHNQRDIEIFRKWVADDMNELPNEKKLEFYSKMVGKTSNHNKYRSLKWDEPSPTVVSHLYKDGLMFIHPDAKQARSITVREAALLQSFPLEYEFIGTDAYCFKMIGNAVPVLFAKSIANAVDSVLERK